MAEESQIQTQTTNKSKNGVVLFEKYEIGRLLGVGASAKVYQATNVETGKNVAVKVMNKKKLVNGGFSANIEREISILSRLHHPNIINLFEVLASKNKIYFIVELASAGELFEEVAKKDKLTEDHARRYFRQLISSVKHCHSHGVFHRDLKLDNLLLDENDNLKVTDFGLSAVKNQIRPDGLLHTVCGTPSYVAPEILAKKGYDGAKADIWSCYQQVQLHALENTLTHSFVGYWFFGTLLDCQTCTRFISYLFSLNWRRGWLFSVRFHLFYRIAIFVVWNCSYTRLIFGWVFELFLSIIQIQDLLGLI